MFVDHFENKGGIYSPIIITAGIFKASTIGNEGFS